MKLTTATKPKKETVPRSVSKVTKQAHYKQVNGARVLQPPVREDVLVDVEVWVVRTTYDGKTERHEFADETDADRFYEGFK